MLETSTQQNLDFTQGQRISVTHWGLAEGCLHGSTIDGCSIGGMTICHHELGAIQSEMKVLARNAVMFDHQVTKVRLPAQDGAATGGAEQLIGKAQDLALSSWPLAM